MPSYYFDSEDSSVTGEAGRCARHFTFRDLPQNAPDETNDLSAHEAALSEIAPSARFTIAYLAYTPGGRSNFVIPPGAWQGYYTPAATHLGLPAPEATCVNNWNNDLDDVGDLDTYETDSENEIGMHQDDLNIVCRGAIRIAADDGDSTVNVPMSPATVNPDLQPRGIHLVDGDGDEPTTTEMDAFFTRSFAIGGVRYPDKLVINVSTFLETGQGGGGQEYTPARLEAVALLHSAENNQNTHYNTEVNIGTPYLWNGGDWLEKAFIQDGFDVWQKTE